MEDGWQEENGLTMEEVIAAIRAAKAEDAPTIRRTEKQLDALRAKGGRTAQARARARKAACDLSAARGSNSHHKRQQNSVVAVGRSASCIGNGLSTE